jgi:hypothetical protein
MGSVTGSDVVTSYLLGLILAGPFIRILMVLGFWSMGRGMCWATSGQSLCTASF